MKQPIEPKKEDCCNSGCNPCIFDVYRNHLLRFERYLEANDTLNQEENGISQLEYNTFLVVDNINILNDSHNILTLKTLNNRKIWWKPGHHFLFKYSSKDNICTRAYTPLKIKIKSKECYDFIVIIKKYDNGFVSNYLCNLKAGALTLWRGPYGNYELVKNKFSRIIMIAQGTGIAPFISIIDSILSNEDDMTNIILLYCCETIDKIILRDELYSYKSYWNFTYHIYISQIIANQVCKYKEPIINKKLCIDECSFLHSFSSNDQFLLCGSSKFMDDYNNCLLNEYNIFAENIQIF